jgi:hypothetical protein
MSTPLAHLLSPWRALAAMFQHSGAMHNESDDESFSPGGEIEEESNGESFSPEIEEESHDVSFAPALEEKMEKKGNGGKNNQKAPNVSAEETSMDAAKEAVAKATAVTMKAKKDFAYGRNTASTIKEVEEAIQRAEKAISSLQPPSQMELEFSNMLESLNPEQHEQVAEYAMRTNCCSENLELNFEKLTKKRQKALCCFTLALVKKDGNDVQVEAIEDSASRKRPRISDKLDIDYRMDQPMHLEQMHQLAAMGFITSTHHCGQKMETVLDASTSHMCEKMRCIRCNATFSSFDLMKRHDWFVQSSIALNLRKQMQVLASWFSMEDPVVSSRNLDVEKSTLLKYYTKYEQIIAEVQQRQRNAMPKHGGLKETLHVDEFALCIGRLGTNDEHVTWGRYVVFFVPQNDIEDEYVRCFRIDIVKTLNITTVSGKNRLSFQEGPGPIGTDTLSSFFSVDDPAKAVVDLESNICYHGQCSNATARSGSLRTCTSNISHIFPCSSNCFTKKNSTIEVEEIMAKEKLKHFYTLLTRFVTTRQMSTMSHNEVSIEKQSKHILCAEWRFSAGNAMSGLGNVFKEYENAKGI